MFSTTNLKNIVILTGAGISAESGLKTFRDNNGLWENHSVYDVATPEGFERDPKLVYRFYNERRKQLQSPQVKPNKAHQALAKLEQHLGTEHVLVVTQNVDNLHEKAGSKNVLHMHGELLSARCVVSHKSFKTLENIDQDSRCHCCIPANPIRPDIVWFGEMPHYMEQIEIALSKTDLFISIGTSGNVYPAAGFVQQASMHNAITVELNLEPSDACTAFDEARYGNASKIVPDFIDELISLC